MRSKAIILILLGIVVAGGLFFGSRAKVVAPTIDENIVVKPDTLPPQAGLPHAVEAKRQAIYAAALTRDYDTLAAQAEPEPNFNYSFGGEYEGGFSAYMKLADENEDRSAFDIIPMLLRLPYALNNNSIEGDIYTWPSVFTVNPAKWTTEDVALMKTFLTDEQIEQYKEYGGYIYYRLGITTEGKWIFYLAGD